MTVDRGNATAYNDCANLKTQEEELKMCYHAQAYEKVRINPQHPS